MAVAALMMIIAAHPRAMQVFAVAVGVSAVVAGLEWNAGLKARALNQLFTMALMALALACLGYL